MATEPGGKDCGMRGGRRNLGSWHGIAVCLLLLADRAPAVEPPVPLECRNGRCTVVLPTQSPNDQYCLIVSSLARGRGSYPVRVTTEAAPGPARVVRDDSSPDTYWLQVNSGYQHRLSRKWQAMKDVGPPAEQPAAAAAPAQQRRFYLFMGEHDFQNAESYVSVSAQLANVGRHCQVYVDEAYLRTIAAARKPTAAAELHPAAAYPELEALVSDAIRTFDEDVYPQAQRRLGNIIDVDRDGRFTILFTPRMSKLANGKVSLGGMVRGSDFYRDLDAPFGNRCDMMFLNTDLVPGPHLRTLLAHEYTHAVTFCEHVFGDYLPEVTRQDEESWLNEALAHVNETLHGHGWSNLDYRISAFLNAPERYSLIVPDYYQAGLFRSHGHRGSAYLFLRWCAEQYGEALLGRLTRTNLSGTRNLEVATGRRFADLFRDWTIDMVRGGRPPAERPGASERAPFSRLLCGPRFHDVPMRGSQCELTLAATSAAYLRLHSPGGMASRITISVDPGADLQATLVHLPDSAGRLSVRVENDRGQARLTVNALGGDVALDAVAWERLAPLARRDEDTSYRPGVDQRAEVRAWFGNDVVKAGQPCISAAIALPPDLGAAVFKVSGVGSDGQPVSGWAACEPMRRAGPEPKRP